MDESGFSSSKARRIFEVALHPPKPVVYVPVAHRAGELITASYRHRHSEVRARLWPHHVAGVRGGVCGFAEECRDLGVDGFDDDLELAVGFRPWRRAPGHARDDRLAHLHAEAVGRGLTPLLEA